MRMCYRVVQVVAGVLSFASVSTNSQGQAKQCGPPNDTSAALVTDLKRWMTTSDPNAVALRDRVFQIPVVPLSELSPVTDQQVCRKVVEAYRKLPEFAYTPSRVYVVRIGNAGYAAYDPDRKGGEFVEVHIFDLEFAHSGGWSF